MGTNLDLDQRYYNQKALKALTKGIRKVWTKPELNATLNAELNVKKGPKAELNATEKLPDKFLWIKSTKTHEIVFLKW